MIEKQIIFEKWKFPTKNDDEEEDDDLSYEEKVDKRHKMPPAVMFHPMGLVPIYEMSNPDKLFNFWIGKTNFDINEKIKDIVEKTDGVEILRIFTRYRFQVGIGPLHNEEEVLANIKKNVLAL